MDLQYAMLAMVSEIKTQDPSKAFRMYKLLFEIHYTLPLGKDIDKNWIK